MPSKLLVLFVRTLVLSPLATQLTIRKHIRGLDTPSEAVLYLVLMFLVLRRRP